ncbi:MAG: hypothetical protein IJT77_12740 [Clostridia bacterium]|nr:hypothetical protein [Clostridia bacterium]
MPAERSRARDVELVPANNAVISPSVEEEIDVVKLLMHLIDKWYWIAIAAMICTLIAAAYTFFLITPLYQSTARLYVVSSKDSAIKLSDLQIGNYLAKDYKEVFNNWHVNDRVISELGLPYSYNALNRMISITNPTDTRILTITVTSPDPEEAKTMAGAYARVACEFIAVKMDQEQPNIFEEPRLPQTPSSPSFARNLIMGFLIGVLIAAGTLTVQFVMDDRVRTAEDIEELLHVPTLGIVTEQDTFHSGHRNVDEKRDRKRKKK